LPGFAGGKTPSGFPEGVFVYGIVPRWAWLWGLLHPLHGGIVIDDVL
jgi:hypothetical protein